MTLISPETTAPSTAPAALFVRSEWAALGLAALSGAMYFLGFAGFEVWPLSLVSLAPLLVALRGRGGWRAARLGWLMGAVTNAGGFYWVVSMLRTFSGFSTPACVALSAILWIAQGLEFALFAWIVSRADHARVHRYLSVPAALAALELCFPLLFPSYTANSLHNVPLLIQFADLGGPILVGALMAFTAAALDAAIATPGPLGARARRLAVPGALWVLAAAYGALRIREVDRENRAAPALRVGVVQENLGLMEKRNEPDEALERHLEATRRMERAGVDLVVWSESAVAFYVSESARSVVGEFPAAWDVRVPVLFGALSERGGRHYNTAFMVDGDGAITGSYDKTYLLAFGEYMPLANVFPALRRWSPNSGNFTAGSRFTAMPLPAARGAVAGSRRHTVASFICYEDILPRFTRDFQRSADASLFAVILNDAWFGDTAEPWIHFALSKFRAIEHRRDFVRAANSGVSGFVDAAGRVISHTGTFSRESQVATVHLRTRRTAYYYVGDWAGWLGVAVTAWVARPRRRRASA